MLSLVLVVSVSSSVDYSDDTKVLNLIQVSFSFSLQNSVWSIDRNFGSHFTNVSYLHKSGSGRGGNIIDSLSRCI